MNICFATSECTPFAKTGGLADVAASLPRALSELGHAVKIFLPLYKSINAERHGLVYAHEFFELPIDMGDYTAPIHVWYGKLPRSEAEVYFIDYPPFFHRGALYTNDADEGERFILLQRSIFAILQRYAWRPDVLHCNDWQTALIPAMRAHSYGWDELFQSTATVLTLHNVGYQGWFGPMLLYKAGLPFDQYYPGGPLEFHGAFNFLKVGVEFADMITTVSQTYAGEIQTPAYGAGLEVPLGRRSADLVGVTNGIDVDEWNPETDPHIAKQYTADTLEDKVANKRDLLRTMGLPFEEGTPVFGIVSRLVDQKGFDLLHPILEPLLMNYKLQLTILGSGQDNHVSLFQWAQERFPNRVRIYDGYSEELAHKIEAGADSFLMPSHYEPCGLNQMYSLRYGTVPVVRKTGGLADTVFDFHESDGAGNGLSFYDYTPPALFTTVLRALQLYRMPETWRGMQQRGMAADFSWKRAARQYEDVYRRAVEKQLH